ncbi:hypothetical protein AB0M94_00760 [Streptomyces xanthochromogenes]|uniref:Bulb-type lectin domain-containing protein n=1 Tax=Streptomyces xanthochromogenes TaxID=67384 RepID=A0ABQ2ZGK5_9ACTN|nr:hypothetical protein [Streptomyces xanthochromogenes]GGY14848.1 hypothetical protein GCM10010326_02960 [Streptomyces xanthochromogenes]
MTRIARALSLTLATSTLTTVAFATTTATAPGAMAAGITCVGSSFSATLNINMAICHSGYTVTMQDNGDLVLRRSNGSACWASGTRAPDASATYNMTVAGPPYIQINSVSRGKIGRVMGAHNYAHMGTSASVNNKGEFWVGYKKVGWC